ncbi:hypothetical protein [Duganella sp. BJB1802]|uniref:hypothetical protein n=1 Tax=Duganella sp. BJB1802 TaxID=2744575 RepID=UPI001E3A29B0|nr:hypothetical protein [Duganella sp. BJB1802]
MLDPLIIMGALYLVCMARRAPFTGYLLVLMMLAFFIVGGVPARRPTAPGTAGACWPTRDTVVGWLITVGVLLLIGAASLNHRVDHDVVLAWFIGHAADPAAQPSGLRRDVAGAQQRQRVALGGDHRRQRGRPEVRRRLQRHEPVHAGGGLFDDRVEDRFPSGAREPDAGPDEATSPPMCGPTTPRWSSSASRSRRSRVHKLLDELQDTTASVYFLPDIYVFDLMQARFDNVGGMHR